MAIRPKIGERVGFTGWEMKVGDPNPPEQPWLGVVVNINRGRSNWYTIKRDHDGKEFTTWSGSLYRPSKEAGAGD
ncbi:hypothetical protein M7775_05765 [Sporomusa sphaeroides DSM 2875]|uniref:hypothetical protein n=1 Tax=Sporomusa sphaeroides TaxID=47679 RepID=UPI00202FDB8C|nr:hypothetical protein [Sporomusa sphaeroides]MCM0758083.1 hypothetical protein [Sporomusa sphaeroides DSM 2875]